MDMLLDTLPARTWRAAHRAGDRRDVRRAEAEGPSALRRLGDWIVRRPDGTNELNVRATLKTDDDQLIYVS